MTTTPLQRWRLLLGEAAAGACGGLPDELAAMDRCLAWLYGREAGLDPREQQERSAGDGASVLSVPEWINEVHRLFPRETIERLERDAVERYRIDEVVTNPQVLERLQPNQALLEAVLRTRHLMNPQVLALARTLVARVVKQLMDLLAVQLRAAFAGVRERSRRTRQAHARNFDALATLRANLRHWQPAQRRLLLQQPLFNTRVRRHSERWQVILLVDQSGSMLGSVIHAAVTAACLAGLPGVRTHLVAFDTEVVDLSDRVGDAVECLLKVQLGGGTDIGKALRYGAQLVEVPKRALLVLVSDFYEGGSPHLLVQLTRQLCGQGSRVLGLAALDEQASPCYDRALAAQLVEAGAQVGAMTPGQLAGWLAQQLRR